MDSGKFDEYNARDSEQVNEVYQMYEEMLGLVRNRQSNEDDGSESDDEKVKIPA